MVKNAKEEDGDKRLWDGGAEKEEEVGSSRNSRLRGTDTVPNDLAEERPPRHAGAAPNRRTCRDVVVVVITARMRL